MIKSFQISLATFAAFVNATPGDANGYARGIPPTTKNCNTYPTTSASGNTVTDTDRQAVAWGLKVDREMGGCKCADEQEQIFTINPFKNSANRWHCRCTNPDLYLSQPYPTLTAEGNVEDRNGKICGITNACRLAATSQQQTRWNQEAARAMQTKNNARTYAKRQYNPIEDEYRRSRVLRNQRTYENRMRSRVYVGALSMKYRAIKNSFLTGALDKPSFGKAYSMTAANLSQYRQQWNSRQADINNQWGMVVNSQRMTFGLMNNELQQADGIYEQTLASIADRYGKRIAYFQSLPIIANTERDLVSQENNRVCPIYEKGRSLPAYPQFDY